MIRRTTVVYIVLLAALVGAYFYLKNRAQPAAIEATAEPTTEVQYLFTAADGTPSSILIKSKSGEAVEVARDAGNAWALSQPVQAKADQGAAEAAASQITSMRVLDSVPDVDPKIVGLASPEYVLTVKFTGGAERTDDIGVITPTESGYYAHETTGKVVIVSKDAIDALLELLKNPPYQETLTPASPSGTTPEVGTVPSETATP